MDARNLVTAKERDDPMYKPMKEILKEKKPKKPKEYICLICDKKLGSRSSLWQHKKTHTGERKYKERVFEKVQSAASSSLLGVPIVVPGGINFGPVKYVKETFLLNMHF